MSFQRFMLKTMLSLPESFLIRRSGGAPLQIDGNTLNPQTQYLAAQAANAPPLTSLKPQEARAAARDLFALLNEDRPAGVETRDDTIPGPGGEIPVRHYRPSSLGEDVTVPALVYYHMGGWVIGDLETCDPFCALLALRAGAHVMSVDYRLAPEHRFPAPMEDGVAAYKWLAQNAESLNIDPKRIGVGGDSAGGGMSAVICHEAKGRGHPQPKAQLLIYPAVDLAAAGGSMESCKDCYPLTKEMMEWFAEHFLNNESERQDGMASPLRREDFGELAPAIVITAGFDVLRDQGEAYAEKLRAAGIPTTYRCYEALAHAFTAQGVIPAAQEACEEIALDLKDALAP